MPVGNMPVQGAAGAEPGATAAADADADADADAADVPLYVVDPAVPALPSDHPERHHPR
jgi:hypothetical protein